MGTRIILYQLVMVFLLLSCKSKSPYSESQHLKNEQDAYVSFFKMQVYCSCLKNSYEDKEIMKRIQKEDLLASFDGFDR